MAKQAIPGVKSGGGALAKLVFALALVGFLALVIRNPAEAADLVTTAIGGLGYAADSLVTFLGGVS